MHLTKPGRPLFLLVAVSSLATITCGPVIKRDLSTIPQGQVGFDDMCGLQDYFDSLEAGVSKEPQVVHSVDLEGGDGKKSIKGGRARLRIEGTFLLKNGKRVLQENWRKLPEELGPAEQFDIEVRWAEKAGVRRVVTDEDAELHIGRESWALPYHVCLSEWLYGAPLYKQRRLLWGLPSPVPTPTAPPPTPSDASAAPEGGAADAGAPGTAGQ